MADYTLTSLRPTESPGTFSAIAAVNFPIGTPVVATANGLAPGDMTSAPHVVGLAAQAGVAGQYVPVQTGGVLELTPAQWDAIDTADFVHVLTTGRAYYLVSNGQIESVIPDGTGTFANQIGIALSATAMLVTVGQAIGPHA
jgi:hypothetical protein